SNKTELLMKQRNATNKVNNTVGRAVIAVRKKKIIVATIIISVPLLISTIIFFDQSSSSSQSNSEQQSTRLSAKLNAVAKHHLDKAEELAGDIAAKGDRYGVDLVSQLRTITPEEARELLDARLATANGEEITNATSKTTLTESEDLIRKVQTARSIFEKLNFTTEVLKADCVIVDLQIRAGRYNEAQQVIDRTLPVVERYKYLILESELAYYQAVIFQHQSKRNDAVVWFARSIKISEQIENFPQAAKARMGLISVYLDRDLETELNGVSTINRSEY
ncbi:MAG: hypothetical protein AB1489_42345, partial [Acidobacteriota bacterium]